MIGLGVNKIKLYGVLLIFLLLFISLACTPKSSPVSFPSPSPILEEVPKGVTGNLWDRTLELALKEKKVVVYSSEGATVRAHIVEEFGKKYGIQVEWSSGTPSELQNKVLTERRAGLYAADIVMMGPTTLSDNLKGQGVFQPIDSYLILSEVKDPSLWYQNKFPWFDKEHTIIGHSAQVNRPVTANSQMVNPKEITDFSDLLNPKWKGKISLNDPTLSGTGQTGFGMMGDFIAGWDFIFKLAQQEPFITRDYRLQVDWLARGRYPIAFWARTEGVYEYRRAGAPIIFLDIKGAGYMTSGSAGIVLLNNAPHPNAAAIYLNWFLSREGQYIYSKARGYQSMRLDVPTDHLDEDILRDPTKTYASSSSPEAVALRDEWDRKSREFSALLGSH